MFKFADDAALVGLTTKGDKTAFRSEVSALVTCCSLKKLQLDFDKTRKMKGMNFTQI